ncbi:MAG: hypothetical protein AB7J32_04460 [Pseudonocardia sp.]
MSQHPPRGGPPARDPGTRWGPQSWRGQECRAVPGADDPACADLDGPGAGGG